MEEIEAKVLEVDPEEIEEKLDDIGAEKKWSYDIESEFFDFPDGRIEEDGLLRVRWREDKTFVTRKKDASYDEAKVMEEIEFEISDRDAFKDFLKSLGLEKIKSSSKHRTKWTRNDTEFVIDQLDVIPPTLEIEAPSKEEMKQGFRDLGFSMDETVNWGAKKMFEKYDIQDDVD
jgi:adenylate cyclase class 2